MNILPRRLTFYASVTANALGTILLLSIPLHFALSYTSTCTQSDTHTWLAGMVNASLTALVAGPLLFARPRYNVAQLAFVGGALLCVPALLRTTWSTTVLGHSLCGQDFDAYGVEAWERLFAPVFAGLLVAYGALILRFRSARRKRAPSAPAAPTA